MFSQTDHDRGKAKGGVVRNYHDTAGKGELLIDQFLRKILEKKFVKTYVSNHE